MKADDKDKLIRDAQYRKGLSIAWFNANNNAVAMVAVLFPLLGEEGREFDNLQKVIASFRDKFLEDHAKYYSEVIGNVGANYNVAETIKKLQGAHSLEELKAAWVSLSEDERHDTEVLKVVKELKGKYAQA